MRPRKRRRSQITHRTHPAKVFRAPPGSCQWCHITLTEKPRYKAKFCGPLCEEVYALHTDPQVLRKYVWKRDMGICRECGTKHPLDGDWECDHILPLMLAGCDWNFWSPLNCQVLCISPCHVEKTRADAILYGIDKPRRRARK